MMQNKWVKVFGTWLLVIIVALLFGRLEAVLGSGVRYIVIYEIVMFAVVWLLNHYWLHVSVFLKPTERSWRLLFINWVTILILIETVVTVASRTGKFWLALSTLVFVGITEEFTFRGLLLPLASRLGAKRNRLWIGVLTSSLLFALAHSVNLLHQSFSVTAFQMVYTFAVGVLLAAIYLRTGSLIFPILLHGINDFVSTYGSGLQNPHITVIGVGIVLIYLVTGLVLLRKTKQDQIKQPISM